MEEKIISLAHGAGGKLSQQLISDLFKRNFQNPILDRLEDSAVLRLGNVRVAFTTDSYVVKPLFFPGGDAGKLAVCGTLNDLSVMGSRPLFISCSLIIEEGLPEEILEKIVLSMRKTAVSAQVQIVTGDTKVVERGAADQVFINTSGLGIISEQINLGRDKIKAGDRVLINGTIGDHAAAVLSSREGLEFESSVQSDCADLSGLIGSILRYKEKIRFMRDPTRGGVATVLNEMVSGQGVGVLLFENEIPLRPEVEGFCDLLGYDPLYLANEGKVIIVVSPDAASDVLEILKDHPLGRESRIIGEVVDGFKGKVGLRTKVGGTRVVDMLIGEQFPRIC
ncbi:MAG: hydrogenase expression/formation protein HypE [Candidatus Zixiibacteriota bacterium]